jgi:cytoskeleton protein RodZ
MTDNNLSEKSDSASETSEQANSEQELWPSPGQKLKKLREELGYSREKVSQSLYMTVHYVTALENDSYEKLPGHTFIKGYYKAYAEFLGADVEQILNYYLKQVESSTQQDMQQAQAIESRNRNKAILWVAVIVVLLSVIAAAFWISS